MHTPQKNFFEMLKIILSNHRRPYNPFSPQLIMAICWEESMFSNIRQVTSTGGAGRGVGFGQVERQELDKLTEPPARANGYFVQGVSKQTTQLPDNLSLQVASCILLHLFHASQSTNDAGRVRFALNNYSGNRQDIINGWLRCETQLKLLPFTEYQIVNFPQSLHIFENKVLDALQATRKFDRNMLVKVLKNGEMKQVKFRETLFPKYWIMPPQEKQKLASFLPPGKLLRWGSRCENTRFLQKLLNYQPEFSGSKPLVADGIYGKNTYKRVIDFQKISHLSQDGIVGQKTKAVLV